MSGINRTGIVAVLVAAELFIVAFGVYSLSGHGVSYAGSATSGNAFVAKTIAPIAAGPAPRVTIDDQYSAVRVSVSHDGLVHITDDTNFNGGWFNSNGAGYPQLQVTHDFGGVTVTRPGFDNDIYTNNSLQQIDVEIPAASQLDITRAGLVSIDGLNGGAISAHCDDGDIEVSDLTTPALDLTSNDGHIEATRITMTGSSAQAKIETDDGHVTVSGLFPAGGNYNISTNDGSVRVGLAQGSDATVNASTNDGSLRVDGVRQSNSDDDDNSSQTVRVGSGASTMQVHSDDGSVAVTTNGAN